MTSERALLRETAAAIFGEHCNAEAHERADGWLPALWSELQEVGFTSIGIPEEGGGAGGTFADAAVVLFEAGRHAAPVPLAEALVAGSALAAAGRDLEPGVVSLGIADEAGLVEIPWGRVATRAVILDSDHTCAFVDLAPTETALERHSNIAGEPRDRLAQAVESPDRLALDSDRCGMLRAQAALARTLQLVGCLNTCVDLTVQYARERSQFGQALGRFQAVQGHLAEMTGEAAAASVAAFAAVASFDENPSESLFAVAAAKVRGATAAGAVARAAHQVHGAIGMTDEHPLHRYTLRAWAWRDEYGSELDWSRRLATEVVAAGADSLWSSIAGGAESARMAGRT